MTVLDQSDVSHSEQIATGSNTGDTAKRRWLWFFGLLLPISLVGFALVSEGVAYGLRNTQPFRNSLDTIAVAAEQVHGNARWLIFSDSLTQHVLNDFSLGPPEVIANLTTHAGAGMPSMYLLLRRYLTTHAAPKAIMLAVSPEVFSEVPDRKDGDFWLVPTFTKPDEQAWLSQFYPSARVQGWRPAAFDLKGAILDRLTGLLAPKRDRLIVGAEQPSPNIPVEASLPESSLSIASDEERTTHHLGLGSTRAVLSDICHIARSNNITVHVVLEPMPKDVWSTWESHGDITHIEQQARDLMAKECGQFFLFEMPTVIQPQNFDDAGTHIVGRGWADHYALALQDYIRSADEK
jgi:hypothetical protein